MSELTEQQLAEIEAQAFMDFTSSDISALVAEVRRLRHKNLAAKVSVDALTTHNTELVKAIRFYANEDNWIDSPSWDGDPQCFTSTVRELMDEVSRLKAERDEYRAKLAHLADKTEVSGLSWNGFNIIGDSKSIKAVQSAIHYGGQIDEYRKEFADRSANLTARNERLMEALKPFAEAWDVATAILVGTVTHGDLEAIAKHHVKPTSFRNARRALGGKNE